MSHPLERWHKPSFRLAACQAGYEHEAGDGYFVNTSCTCTETNGGGDCEHCQHEDEFSSRSCEVCGSPLGGSRHLVVRIHPRDPNINYDACSDCVYYIEYGQLDDETMIRVEEEDP